MLRTSLKPSVRSCQTSSGVTAPWQAVSPSAPAVPTVGAPPEGSRQKNPPYPAPVRPFVAGLPSRTSRSVAFVIVVGNELYRSKRAKVRA